ncbi:glycosyltransferase [Salinisphaera sp. SWV1]|uniref:glycosyltransferase n=1 Tax=Salinisphaera sp. SWV1 TaxID=3454139 RepID=UPI003F866BE5
MNRRLEGERVAIVVAGAGAAGGAERFYAGLMEGFRSIGAEPELVTVAAEEFSFEQILENYAHCAQLDLSEYALVVSTKAPTYAVRHPNHVIYLVHTVRVFDDMFEDNFPDATAEQRVQRYRLHELDFQALSSVRARFSIGHEVSRRLYRWRGLDSKVLHPPLAFHGFREGPIGDYFFLPGRLHPWKRVDLLVDAVRSSKLPLKLIIAGTGEAEAMLRARAEDDDRIRFLGHVSDRDLVDLYANALAVPFVPLREDYGYVTLEAFASGKPVLTCSDSGEPSRLVQNLQTGLVVKPCVDSVRDALEFLWQSRDDAARMGRNGRQVTENMSWTTTVETLADAGLGITDGDGNEERARVAVLDMQPIDPPVGGGRQRLLGLYHNLDLDAQYVGTYDWPGERRRAHRLSPTLFETDVPLSNEHHAAAAALSARVAGKVVIDLAFSQHAHLSQDFLAEARSAIATADVVVFSHPWVYPLVRDALRPDHVVIYDSQNVEGFLRAQLLDESDPTEASLLHQVVQDEYEVGRRADWILACSHEDLLRFNRIYEFALDRMRLVPNGVMAFGDALHHTETRTQAREVLQIDVAAFVAVFIGSGYGPNLQAAYFINDELAPAMPDVIFVIAGGAGDGLRPSGANVRITGSLDESIKYRWFRAADIALNPVMAGSGTNIKMFDYMAMSLPVVTTRTGARGIDVGRRQAFWVVDPKAAAFRAAIETLMDSSVRFRAGEEARQCIEDGYAWERISEQLGIFFDARIRIANQPRPLFSVVVPTYERHHQLNELMDALRRQLERDFEVIVVDQSADRWEAADDAWGFCLTYYHCPVNGAVRARNTGAFLAQGQIIAFVDDDCVPEPSWLLSARGYFENPHVVGVEGFIESDHPNDPDWRPVTNRDFHGIGFMTANLMVRSGAFQYLGGFDLKFDQPHFREDTEFGWRLLEIGQVPFASDAVVFHPAQPRDLQRESHSERVRLFTNDALLYQKHPEKYRALFFAERHFEKTPGFADYLRQGFEVHGITMPDWLGEYL